MPMMANTRPITSPTDRGSQRAVGADRDGDEHPHDGGADHQRRGRRGRREDDVRDRPALVERVSEVAVEDAAEESRYCFQYGSSMPSSFSAWAMRSGVGLRPAVRSAGVAPVKRAMTIEEEPGEQTSRRRPARSAGPQPLHDEVGSSLVLRVEGVAQTVAEQVERQHRHHQRETGTSASAGTTRYSPELTLSDSIWPQLAVGGGTPTPR